MSRTPGLVKRKWQWVSKDGLRRTGWSYATRLRLSGKDTLFVHGTQHHGDALRKHRQLLEGLEEISLDIEGPWASGSKRLAWRSSTTVAVAAREAAMAFGHDGIFSFQRSGGEVLDGRRELRDERLRDGDRLRLVSRVTVDTAHEQWRGRDLAVRRNPRGQRETTARYLRHVSPLLGQQPLDALTGEHIRELRVQLDATLSAGRKQVLKPETVRHTLADLRCFLHWAADPQGGKLICASPWPGKCLPKVGKRPPDRLTDEEVEAVLAVGEPHAFVVRLGLATGLRWGDMCRALASDLKHDASGGWCLEVAVGKTGEVLRVPVTDPDLVRLIRSRIGRLVPFSGKSGTVFNRTVRRRSHVERFHVHQLRHTFACRYLERGGSLAALQQILGHASVTTTERYARLLHTHVMQDAQRVGRAVGPDNSGDKERTSVEMARA